MKVEKLMLIALAAFLGGCSQPEQAPSQPVKPKPQSTAPAVPAPAAPDVAPPPAVPTTAAVPALPGAAPSQAAPGVPAGSPGSDPLFYFRRDESGRVRSDLEALQEAAIAYSRKAGISESADRPPWPDLTDLAQMVQVGMLKALPAAPEGKKYVVDRKTHKVSLVNK